MFKNLILASTAIVSFGSAALAADLPSRRAPAPYVAVPVFTWTGFYIGGNAGYVMTDQRNAITTGLSPALEANVAAGGRPRLVNTDKEGFTGGGQVGYNYQFGSIVLGVEADAAYTDLSRNRVFATGSGINAVRTDLGYIGTVRGRVGYAFDRLLVYGTGGFAYGDVTNRVNFFNPAATALLYSGGRDKMETGFAAGGGVEYALPSTYSFFGSNTVTLKAEALYYDLGRKSVLVTNTPAAAGPGYATNFETSGIIARAGINVKFNTF